MNPAYLALLASIVTIIVQQGLTAIFSWNKTKAEASKTQAEATSVMASADHTFGKSYGDLLDRLEIVISKQDEDSKRLNKKIVELREEVSSLREELHHANKYTDELEEVASRFRDLPGDEPMSVFVERWLDVINSLIAEKIGLKMAIYLDDVDGRFALGHRVVPVEHISPDQSTSKQYRMNRTKALTDYAIGFRESLGLNPYPIDALEKEEQEGYQEDDINAPTLFDLNVDLDP